MPEQQKLVFDFTDAEEAKRWIEVNDGVMGGLSKSEILVTSSGTAVFQGDVSLENYGGFASVRTLPDHYRLDGYDGIALRLSGDGKRYKLRLRTDSSYDGLAFEASFDTAPGRWVIVRVPFRDCLPTFRGRHLRDVPALDPAQIQQIGLMIADKQQGPFRLEIDWITAYRTAEQP
jgi:monofunctional biosynthetic peptidoglycan transglycosylase